MALAAPEHVTKVVLLWRRNRKTTTSQEHYQSRGAKAGQKAHFTEFFSLTLIAIELITEVWI